MSKRNHYRKVARLRNGGSITASNARPRSFPWQLDARGCSIALADRVLENVLQTGHPLHHQSRSGAIVAPDPAVQFYLVRLEGVAAYQGQCAAIRRAAVARDQRLDIPPALPVNRLRYGFDPYEQKL